MGMFGGDDKKKKGKGKGEEETGSRRRSTQRRSRRIVTPGAKPGGGGGGETRRPASSANIKQRSRPPSGPAPKPEAPAEPELDAGPELEIGAADLQPSAPAPASGGVDLDGPSISGPGIQKGDGKKPITASNELEFSGDLGAAAGGGSVNRSGDQPLIDFLVNKASLIDSDQAGQAKAKAEAEDLAIDVACTQMGLIDEEQLVNALTQECWVPHLKVDKYEIRKKALDTISEEDARRYSVLPVDKLGSILNLAMVNPLDVEAIRVLESKTGLDIKKVVATRGEINQGIDKYYGGGSQAKEGGLDIQQDHDSRRVTQMLSKAPEPAAPAPAPAPEPAAAAPSANDPVDVDDIADIDDLLGGDEAVAPSIVEPITIGADEIEPEEEVDDLEVVSATPAAEPAAPAPEPVPEPAEPTPASIDIGGLDLSSDESSEPEPELSIGTPEASEPEPTLDLEPSIEPPAPEPAAPEPAAPAPEPAAPPPAPEPAAPAPQPAAAAPQPAAPTAKPAAAAARAESGPVNLIPVMEEEFQHAITHGKSRLFEKWTSLQTRNRILNVVMVETELDQVLSPLYAKGERIAV